MTTHPHPDLLCTTDASAWRELMRLLAAKAYRRMTPREIAELLPDLREVKRELTERRPRTELRP